MKTAISLPDDLFVLADEFAKARGISRSELYATAVREYLSAQRTDTLTEQINKVCQDVDTRRPIDVARSTRRKLLEVEW